MNFALQSACAKSPAPAIPARPAQVLQAPAISPLQQLQQDIVGITQRPGVQRGSWGVVVHSLDRHETLFELNPRALLVPASSAKLLAVATAVDVVGWDYRYETTLGVTGVIEDGTLRGDLIVTGSGDPAIGGRGGDDLTAFVEAVKAAGITRIEGRVIGDDNAIEDPRPMFAWTWDDIGYAYGAMFGALNYAENRLAVTIHPGAFDGQPTTLAVEPFAVGRPLINRTTTVAKGAPQLLWAEQRPGEPGLTIAGTIQAGAAPARLSISAGNPTIWFALVLRNTLVAHGITVAGDAADIDDLAAPPAGIRTIYTYRSRPLAEMVEPMLKESINLYAEAAMRLNAAPESARTNDDALAGFKARMSAWGIPPDEYQVVDGSGLSRRDVVAPMTFLAVLRRMYDATGASPWMRALPVGGIDGTLDARLKGTLAENNVRAKTGTMSNIRALAGYVTTAGGERLAFVVMLDNFEGTGANANQAIDAIAVKLAEFKR